MLGWMKHKLESRLPGKYQSPQIWRWCYPYARNQRGTEELLDEGKRGEWKSWLKTQHWKNKDHGIWLHHFIASRKGKKEKQWQIFSSWAPKSLQVVTCSVAQLCPSLWRPMNCSTPGLSVHHQLPELAQIHIHWDSDAIQSSHPLSSLSPPAFSLSQHQGLFKWASSSHQWPKYWSFSFSISPSNEYSGLISFRMDCLDLLAVQGTLKSLLQHHSSKVSIFWCSAFFIAHLSHPYMTTGKTIAFTRRPLLVKECLYLLICCLGWS